MSDTRYDDLIQRFTDLRQEEDWEKREAILDRLSEISSVLAWVAGRLMIGDEEASIRDSAGEMLEAFGSPQDTYALIIALKHDPSWIVRASAASALGKIATTDVRTALIARLFAEEDGDVKRYIGSALGRFSDDRLIPILRLSLAEETRPAAITGLLSGLYQLGETDVLPELLLLLEEEDYQVRCQVVQILLENHTTIDREIIRQTISLQKTREHHAAVLEYLRTLEEKIALSK